MIAKENWNAFWAGTTPESEIRMRDFYGGRQWIVKHTPRFGKVIEAGCGLGRYVFYLSRFGIDIDGVDFHEEAIKRARQWAIDHGFDTVLKAADVLNLPYESGSVSGYLSFGVVEHFIEGPHRAILEARRVLRPGGIAIITTPSVSYSRAYLRLVSSFKGVVKRAIRKPVVKPEFFQYWYTPRRLASFVEDSGLKVVLFGGGDLLYSMWELGIQPRDNAFFKVLTRLENGFLSRYGAQSFTVSVKEGPRMFCFLCGAQNVEQGRLCRFYLPVCERCERSELAGYYRHAAKPRFHDAWSFGPESRHSTARTCSYCEREFLTDGVFEDFGLSVPVCGDCLRKPEINIELSNKFVKPVWGSSR